METTVDRSTITTNLTAFKAKWLPRLDQWRAEKRGGTEQSHEQQFWTEFLGCFGIKALDLYLYQRKATRSSTGNVGWIDVFMPRKLIGETKSLDKGTDKAFEQARDYLLGGTIAASELPAYCICTDFATFRVDKLGSSTLDEPSWSVTFRLDDIEDHIEQLVFLADHESTEFREQKAASLEASRLMAQLFTAMAGDVDVERAEDETDRTHNTSIILTRLLFLLFGDDAGLWNRRDLFDSFVRNETTPETLGAQLSTLFSVLNTPVDKRPKRLPPTLAAFPYVNGGIFADPVEPEFFDKDMWNALMEACDFNWSKIDVSIFGSLFQLVKSREARRADGEHYTSGANIEKTLGPLFLDDLRQRAHALVSDPSSTPEQLDSFAEELASLVLCDPACGSGNFLIYCYRELRRIETDIIVAAVKRRRDGGDMSPSIVQRVSINQFYGFELNWWPAKLAETGMFLIDHQENQHLASQVGVSPQRFPITTSAHIYHGSALTLEWAEVLPKLDAPTYVFGNPPFVGQGKRSQQQALEMKQAWGKDYAGYLDFVTSWHAKTLQLFADGRPGRFAFVTTNSISQGQPVANLFGPIYREGWDVLFAHRSFQWDSEAPGKAAVHCVIVGFERGDDTDRKLWDYSSGEQVQVPVPAGVGITPYLTPGPHVTVTKRPSPLSPTVGKVFSGSKPAEGGNLIFGPDEYAGVMADPIAAKYVRPFVGADELVKGKQRWCLWLVDSDPADRAKSPLLRERIAAVRTMRENAPQKGDAYKLRKVPHLFRDTDVPETDYVCIPAVVSEHRPYFTTELLSKEVVSSNATFVLEDPDGLQFALLSSSMFLTWQKTMGGRLGNGIRFANTLAWNNFPVPELTDKQRARIIAAGKGVLAARKQHPDRSLAEHYTRYGMEPALIKAHDKLDREIDAVFGLTGAVDDEQRQQALFEHYKAMTE